MINWLSKLLESSEDSQNNLEALPLLITIAWCLWLHRNQVIFEGTSPNPTEVMLTTQSLLNRYKQGYQQGNMPLHPPRIRQQIQFPQEWQLIILISNVATKNKQWQGTAFIGKNRQGEVLFVGCKTLRIAAGTMAKFTTIRDASLQASILGIRGCIFLTTSKGLEGM